MAKASNPSIETIPRGQASPLAQEIRELMPRLQAALILAKSGADSGKRADQLEAVFDRLCDQAWAAPVRNFDDLVLLAEIAQHSARDWPAHGKSDGLDYPR